MNYKLLQNGIRLILFAGVLLFVFLSFRNTDDPRIVKIFQQLETFTLKSKVQKVYLKTDKERYITGETIWLKAYVLNAANLKPETISNEVFVDLLGVGNKVYQSIIIQNTDGFAKGDIELNDSIPEGNYQIVAYTNWMKNFDNAYFFSKTIQIVNPQINKYLNQQAFNNIKQNNKDYLLAEKERTVQFFPEGGTLIGGIGGRMAFKAINGLGLGVNVKGEVFDEANRKACSFESKHLGMGSFMFTPEPGRKYYAKCIFDDGVSKKVDLPAIETNGFVLLVNPVAGDQIRVNVQANITNTMDEKSSEFFIVGQARGELRYISKGTYRGKPVNVSIPKKLFPAGIAQITIFDYQANPLCERLVFVHPKETEFNTNMEVSRADEGPDIVYKIRLQSNTGKPASGNMTFSVCENTDIGGIQTWGENILSNLLLTSDLKGKIEHSTSYFDEANPQAPIDLDLVMMINGWRRFVWKEIMAGQFPVLLFTPSIGLKPDEMFATSLKPSAINISDKAYFSLLNENYDARLIKKNTREAQRASIVKPYDNPAGTLLVDQNAGSYSDMVEYLKGRVAGVTVMESGIRIRGVNSINSGLDPLILQDGVEIGFATLKTISPREVTSVEVLKGPDASLYGVRGANGVIIVHMRKGADNINYQDALAEQPTERIISFRKAREFYVPSYDSWEKRPSEFNVPRAVFWKPDIEVDSTGTAIVRFRNRTGVSDTRISIEGMASDGSVLFYQSAK